MFPYRYYTFISLLNCHSVSTQNIQKKIKLYQEKQVLYPEFDNNELIKLYIDSKVLKEHEKQINLKKFKYLKKIKKLPSHKLKELELEERKKTFLKIRLKVVIT